MTSSPNTPPHKGVEATPDIGSTHEQEFLAAFAHHQAGRLEQAKAAYREVRRRYPGSHAALHYLGAIAHQEGDHDLAVELMSKAITENDRIDIYHGNLGEVYRDLGRYDEAIACCRRAIENTAVYPEALNTLGAALSATGEHGEAEAVLRRAVEFKPNLTTGYANLGNVLSTQGKHQEAVAAYREALRLEPSFAGAHAALGEALHKQGKSEEAVTGLQKALETAPNDARIWFSLGTTLMSLARVGEAVESFREASRLVPGVAVVHADLGMALVAQGEFAEAIESFATALDLKRGRIAGQRGRGIEEGSLDATFCSTTLGKLRHDVEQLRYLLAGSILPASFGDVIDSYELVIAELGTSDAPTGVVALTSEQQEKIGETYNRRVYIAAAPALSESPLNPRLDVEAIEDDYRAGAPGLTYFDDILTPEAFGALRRFCLESTVWYKFDHVGDYLSADLSDGFNCELLFQIAEELRTTFPRIFGDSKLRRMWAWKYDNCMRGLAARATAGGVNVNLWVTPDDANLDVQSGGVTIFKREAPKDWDFETDNVNEARIEEFLAGTKSITIPYRQNRAILFNSNLFYNTESISFKEGYENRRIDITLLFGPTVSERDDYS